MKQLLIIFASPHKNGNTAAIVKTLMEYVPQPYQSTVVYPYQMNPGPCVDCGYCKTKDGCAFHDLDGFYRQFEQADAVLFASPLYNLTFPSPLKAVLDRFQRYFNARFLRGIRPPIEKPKRVGLVMTAGSENDGGFLFSQKALEQSLTVLNGSLEAVFFQEECDKTPKAGITEEAAKQFLHAWLG